MERKLKRQFILTGFLAAAILIIMIDLGFRILSYRQLSRSLDQTITFIIEHNGTAGMIESEEETDGSGAETGDETEGVTDGESTGEAAADPAEESTGEVTAKPAGDSSDESSLLEKLILNFHDFGESVAGNVQFTPETRYKVRYFLVTIDEEGNVEDTSLSHIAAVGQDAAEDLALRHYHVRKDSGLLTYGDSTFYFKQMEKDDGTTVAGFLECSQEVRSLRNMRRITILINLMVTILFTIILACLSGSAIRPYMENIESQKQFITNASHEMKTPLAIISANTEVIEMMDGKTEWTDSIREQVTRSTSLINSMLALARANETEKIELAEVSLSEAAAASVKSFGPVITQQKKTMDTNIAEDVKVLGDRNLLSELCNILIDNAAKYCDEGGAIHVVLKKKGKSGAILQVSNDYREGGGQDYRRFFRRFYRGDTSHNSRKAGHGIGLSMAQTIVSKMKGNISASWKDGVITFTVTL